MLESHMKKLPTTTVQKVCLTSGLGSILAAHKRQRDCGLPVFTRCHTWKTRACCCRPPAAAQRPRRPRPWCPAPWPPPPPRSWRTTAQCRSTPPPSSHPAGQNNIFLRFSWHLINWSSWLMKMRTIFQLFWSFWISFIELFSSLLDNFLRLF